MLKRFSNIGFALVCLALPCLVWGQPLKRKFPRAQPPTFQAAEFEGIFFSDIGKQFQGARPNLNRLTDVSPSSPKNANATTEISSQASEMDDWKTRISSSTIEDLLKQSKQRLDQIVTTPAKLAGGGYNDARREFNLVAMLFGIIEQYPGQVRFKSSASMGRTKFARAAANSRVFSPQSYKEAKDRLQELGDLLNGTSFTTSGTMEPLEWPTTVDHSALMQLLDLAFRENLVVQTATPTSFKESIEEAQRNAELIAAIGHIIAQPGMEHADDSEYQKWAKQMMKSAMATAAAIKNDQPDLARQSSGLIDQSCNQCHNSFR